MKRTFSILVGLTLMTALLVPATSSAVKSPTRDGVRTQVTDQLMQALQGAIDDPAARIQIKSFQASDTGALKAAKSVISVEILPGERPYGRVTTRAVLGLRAGGEKRVFVMAEVEVMVPVWVVQRRIRRGAPIGELTLDSELRSLQGLPNGALRTSDALLGRVAARMLRKGSVLTRAATTTPELIRRGDAVTVTSRVGAVLIRTRGQSMGAGRSGERVNVRLQSRRVVAGYVSGPGEVVIR
ncbi:MAG: flagella basal body P-ring formation protein FlgA [Myxococcota bacterium]|jgi:flagella basal body P-ring formation protein FlgA